MNHAFSEVNPLIMREPERYARVVRRLEVWEIEPRPDEDPGWEFIREKAEEGLRVFREEKQRSLETMQQIAALLADDEYFAAFRTVQEYSVAERSGNTPVDPRAAREALGVMRRIEAEKALVGFAAAASARLEESPLGAKELDEETGTKEQPP